MKYIESNIPENYKVKVTYLHQGNHKNIKHNQYVTFAEIIDRKTQKIISIGYAHCGKRDIPQRARGREVAVGRAFKNGFNRYGRVKSDA